MKSRESVACSTWLPLFASLFAPLNAFAHKNRRKTCRNAAALMEKALGVGIKLVPRRVFGLFRDQPSESFFAIIEGPSKKLLSRS